MMASNDIQTKWLVLNTVIPKLNILLIFLILECILFYAKATALPKVITLGWVIACNYQLENERKRAGE